jgi:hypothetical protein
MSSSSSSSSSNSSSNSAVDHVYTTALQHQPPPPQQQQQQQGYFLPQHLQQQQQSFQQQQQQQQPFLQQQQQSYAGNTAAARTAQLSPCTLATDMARMAVSASCAQPAASAVAAGLISPINSSPITLMPACTAAFRPHSTQLLQAHQLCVPQQQQQQQQVLLPTGALVSQQMGAHSMSPAHTACFQCGTPYGLAPAGMQLHKCLPMPALHGMLAGVQEDPAAAAAAGGFLQPQHSPQQQQQVPGSYMLMPQNLTMSQPAAMGYPVTCLGQTQGDVLHHMSPVLGPAAAAVTLPAANMAGHVVQMPLQQMLLHTGTQMPPAAPVLQAAVQTTTGLTLQQGMYPF